MKVGIPKGSLQTKTIEILNYAGYGIVEQNRNYNLISNSKELKFILVKPSEIPKLVLSGVLDCGLTGKDILYNNMLWDINNPIQNTFIVSELHYSKSSFIDSMYVIAVKENSGIHTIKDLYNITIATERLGILQQFLKNKNIENVKIIESEGATENKVAQGLCDAICDITETGASLRANNLRVVTKVCNTCVVGISLKEIPTFTKMCNMMNIVIRSMSKNHYVITVSPIKDALWKVDLIPTLIRHNISFTELEHEIRIFIDECELRNVLPILDESSNIRYYITQTLFYGEKK